MKHPLIIISFLLYFSCSPQEIPLDILLTDAWVFTGQDESPQKLDVGILGDKIEFIGKASDANLIPKEIFSAKDHYLAPGFIDPHTHLEGDLSDPEGRANLSALMQGVTTIIGGNDGGSPLPVGRKLDEWERNGLGTNVAMFVGHGTIRRVVMGSSSAVPTPQELEEMETLVKRSMEEGAFGLSTGLFYAPGNFAELDEILALAKVAHSYGGIYDTHMRDESSYSVGLLAAVEEAIEVGRGTGIPVHISHIKALGADVWGQSEEVVKMIEQARNKGIIVTANQYPYFASKTGFQPTVIPRWAEEGGHEALMQRLHRQESRERILAEIKDNIRKRGGAQALVFSETSNPELEGISLKEAAQNLRLSEPEAVVHLVSNERGLGVISYNMVEEDLRRFMTQPWVVTGSDASSGHPRKFGSFARKIGHYSLEKEWMDLSTAIYQSSAQTAAIFGIEKRGQIKEGYFADLVIFDPNTFRDKATFESPYELATGVTNVFVNGEWVVKEGVFTSTFAGRTLRKVQ
ncbi:N-acyl-D-amino-acid deacylase family protein [Pleomorphovibrio marinus]|uniref:N-acyl-D-amino-acid deacylase family protein n=1 Tax=Pleomorphovibrio marinus TaxID=2164132 RepID=UPI000E09FC2E|nr:amidohydrolase family protein [Pleomorphovibrio marinus]